VQKPLELRGHPTPFSVAMRNGIYRAVGQEIKDGDTFVAMVDVGFQVYPFIEIRVKDIDTPEIVGASRAEGLTAAAFTAGHVVGRHLLLRSQLSRTGTEIRTFERYVADVWFQPDAFGYGESLADALVDAGLAVRV
jgi:endonuclease YncB( thermonuclease family)